MNKTIKLAVAGAVLSAASIANAGIIIPAGEWTMDINGNVNVFATMTNTDDTATVTGGLAGAKDAAGEDTGYSTGTGLITSMVRFYWYDTSKRLRRIIHYFIPTKYIR